MPELMDVLQEELQEVLTQEVGTCDIRRVMHNVIAITRPDADHTVLLHLNEGQDLVCIFKSTSLKEHGERHWFAIAHPKSFDHMTHVVVANLD